MGIGVETRDSVSLSTMSGYGFNSRTNLFGMMLPIPRAVPDLRFPPSLLQSISDLSVMIGRYLLLPGVVAAYVRVPAILAVGVAPIVVPGYVLHVNLHDLPRPWGGQVDQRQDEA